MSGTTVSVSEARATLPEVLDRVIEGDEIIITRHGKPVAVMIRPDRLRHRRAAAIFQEAEFLRERIEEAGRRSLSELPTLAPGRADELVAQLRRDRDAE